MAGRRSVQKGMSAFLLAVPFVALTLASESAVPPAPAWSHDTKG